MQFKSPSLCLQTILGIGMESSLVEVTYMMVEKVKMPSIRLRIKDFLFLF